MEAVKEKPQTQKYPAYKDSGVDWLGDIPEHWELKRLGSRFEERKTKVSDKEFPPLSVTKNGILPQLENAAKSNDGDNRKLVKKGDFVINSRSDRKGSSGISDLDGSVSLINIVMKPFNLYGPFSNYLLKSTAFVEENYRIGHGIVADLWTTRFDELKNIKAAFPPLDEQTSIAHFLDEKCGKIDTAIAQKQQLIELLKERKQIIIQNAVTKGLDPDVKMKNSGVEWIGEIPEHWEVSKLSYLSYKIGDGLHGTPIYTDNTEYFFINGNNLGNKKISITEATKTVSDKEFRIHQKDLNSKTILLSINGTIGNVALYQNEKVMLGKSAAYINLLPHINRIYIANFLESRIFKNYYQLELSGSTINNLSLFSIGKTPVVLPTDEEQKEIIRFIESETGKIENAITLQQQQIEKLKEYKSSLIDAAVTGKIKVS